MDLNFDTSRSSYASLNEDRSDQKLCSDLQAFVENSSSMTQDHQLECFKDNNADKDSRSTSIPSSTRDISRFSHSISRKESESKSYKET